MEGFPSIGSRVSIDQAVPIPGTEGTAMIRYPQTNVGIVTDLDIKQTDQAVEVRTPTADGGHYERWWWPTSALTQMPTVGRESELVAIDVVFDGPPSHESGRFIEVEDEDGAGVGCGRWRERDDGFWALRFMVPGDSVRR